MFNVKAVSALCLFLQSFSITYYSILPSLAYANDLGSTHSPPRLVTFPPTTNEKENQHNINASDHAKEISNSSQRYLAEIATVVGNSFDSDQPSKKISDALVSHMTNNANTEIVNWLNKFGNSRVTLGVDQDFSLSESSIDFLSSLYEDENNLFFYQLGARYKDNRATLNIGVGARYFSKNWMLGINSFYDDDITGHNRRYGFGVEGRRDYINMALNTYHRASGWHSSRDFSDYDERPANGFDIRLDGYLPAHPQLGGKLIYEYYQGDDVALFGKNSRDKNPSAITVGVNYTPIPLVSFSLDHRQGLKGRQDTQAQMNINYRFGIPWSQQSTSSMVGPSRMLDASRYDFVSRNNNIVLDYKKHELINLILPSNISGIENTTVLLTPQVNAKYGLDRIEWDLGELHSLHNSQNKSSVTKQIKVPKFIPGGNNIHRISAIAYDRNGNASSKKYVDIISFEEIRDVEDAIILKSVNIVKDNAKADGIDFNELEILVTDKDDNPLDGKAISLKAEPHILLESNSLISDINGIARVKLSTNKFGVSKINVFVSEDEQQEISVNFIANTLTAMLTSMVSIQDNSYANGMDVNIIQVKVVDAFNNPVKDQQVTFNVDASVTIISESLSDASGIATLKLASNTVGTTSISAELNGSKLELDTRFITDGISGNVEISYDAIKEYLANGHDSVDISVLVKDSYGNPLAGELVLFASQHDNNGVKFTDNKIYTNNYGIAHTKMMSTFAGNIPFTIENNGNKYHNAAYFKSDDAMKGYIKSLRDPGFRTKAAADGIDEAELYIAVVDIHGNRINKDVNISADNGAIITTPSSLTVPLSGSYIRITNNNVGVSNITIKTDGESIVFKVFFVIPTNDISSETLEVKNNAEANGIAFNSMRVKFRKGGMALVNYPISFDIREKQGHHNPGKYTIKNNVMFTDDNGEVIGELSGRINSTVEFCAIASYGHGQGTGRCAEIIFTESKTVEHINFRDWSSTPDATNTLITVTNSEGRPIDKKDITLSIDGDGYFTDEFSNNDIGSVITKQTNSAGELLFSTRKKSTGKSIVTVTVDGKSASMPVFIASGRVQEISMNLNKPSAWVEPGGAVDDFLLLTVKAKSISGSPISGAKISFSVPETLDRQGNQFTATGKLLFNDMPAETFNAETDKDGLLTVKVRDPNGKGVASVIQASASTGTNQVVSHKITAIFRVATSPDTAKANMWGHMVESVDGLRRPPLATEVVASSRARINNEDWALLSHQEANFYCYKKLPSQKQLSSIYQRQGSLSMVKGWPQGTYYSSDVTADGKYLGMDLDKGYKKYILKRETAYASCH